MALSHLFWHSKAVAISVAVVTFVTPGFILYPSTNTTPIAECASMDLPHMRNIMRNYSVSTISILARSAKIY